MHKRIAFTVVGLVLLSAPLAASAQLITLPSVPQNASVQQLQTLIQQLTQILNQLLAIRYPTASNTTFDALPKAGLSPLTVLFSSSAPGGTIDFGDSSTAIMSSTQCSQIFTLGFSPRCTLSHTYSSTGTYRAKLTMPSCVGYACPQAIAGAVTITVLSGDSDTCPSANRSPACSAGSHLVGAQVFGGCRVGGQCVTDSTTNPPTTSTPSCSVSYSPSTINRNQTLGITWSGIGTTRSFFVRKSATGQTFGTSTIAVNGVQQDTSFRTLDLGTYVRTDTVSNTTGTATCSATLTIVATTSSPTTCPVYQQPLCPSGQHNVNSGNTTDANGCAVPHYSCVVYTGTCTYAYGQGSVTVADAAACRTWCANTWGDKGLGIPAPPSQGEGLCTFRDANGSPQVVGSAPAENPNLASVLTALSSVLRVFLGQ